MQTTKQLQANGIDVTKLHVSGYQLTTALLRGGLARLELNNTASLVLLYLASCYNGGAIYPRISTIASNVGISEISVKRGIAELLNKQCLMKSKRHNGTNANCYVLTNKILSLYQDDTNKSITVIPNKYIPLIMAVLGAVLNIWVNSFAFTPEILLGGMFSGLASTGVHQLFTQFIGGE